MRGSAHNLAAGGHRSTCCSTTFEMASHRPGPGHAAPARDARCRVPDARGGHARRRSHGGRARSTTCGGAALFIHIVTLSEGFSPRATRPPAIGWRPAHRRTARVRCPVPLLDRGFPTHVHSRRAPMSGEGWSRSPRRRSRLSHAPTLFRRSTSGPHLSQAGSFPGQPEWTHMSLGVRWSRACWGPTHLAARVRT